MKDAQCVLAGCLPLLRGLDFGYNLAFYIPQHPQAFSVSWYTARNGKAYKNTTFVLFTLVKMEVNGYLSRNLEPHGHSAQIGAIM